jgi:PKD repeat protein
MKKIILLLFSFAIFISESIAQNTCVNADFSSGDFTNWVGSIGENDTGTYINTIAVIVMGTQNSPPSDTGRQTIMNQAGTDPNTGNLLNVLPPGGVSSCRIGNDLCSGCVGGNPQAERLGYTYNVNATNCIFTFQYAVVLQDPGITHLTSQKPKFNIQVLSGATLIDSLCGIFEITAGTGTGYNTCLPASTVCSPTENVVWKDWTTNSIDLSAYIGQNITIQFTTFDCVLGGHFGYAYISCYCGAAEFTQTCFGDTNIVTAPIGFDSYEWYINGATVATTTSNFYMMSPVLNGDNLACIMTAVTGCKLTLQTVINCLPTPLTQQCTGNSVIITAPSGYLSYLWNTGETTNFIIVSNPVPGDSVSCICISSTDSITLSALVSTQPITGLSVNSSTICNGDSAVITASGTYTYEWSDSQTGATITVYPSTTTTYTVTAISAGGCTAKYTSTVTVYPAPTGTFTTTPATCGISDGTIMITPTNGIPPYNYTWNTLPQQTTQTATGLPAGIYTLTLTDGNGCSSVLSVTLNNTSVFTDSITSTSDYYWQCNGTATVSPIGGAPPYSYLWSTSPTQTTKTVTGLCYGTYFVTITDANNCTKTDSIIVTLIDTSTCTASFYIYPDSTNILSYYFVNISTGIQAGSGYSFLWSLGGGFTTTDLNPQYTYQLPGTYTVCLSIKDSLGDIICSYCDSLVVDTNLYLIQGKVHADSLLANNSSVILFNADYNYYTACDYQIANNGSFEFDNVRTGKYIIYAVPDTSLYPDYFPTYYGNVLYWQNAYIINVFANTYSIDVNLIHNDSISNKKINGMIAGSIIFGNESTYEVEIFGQNWFGGKGSRNLAGKNIPVFINNSNGYPLDWRLADANGAFSFNSLQLQSYTVTAEKASLQAISPVITLTSSNPTLDNVIINIGIHNIVTSVEEQLSYDLLSALSYYPNPVSNDLNIDFSLEKQADIEISIWNITGQVIKQYKFKLGDGLNKNTLNVSDLKTGMYFVQIKVNDSNTYNFKFIK